MVVDFSKIDLQESPVLILKNTAGTPIGVLGAATHVTADIKYNEASVLEFNLPARVDGEDTPHYQNVVGMRIVDLQDVGQFILINPKESGDGVKKVKACKGYSLEYEFTFKKITLESATYNFWNPVMPESSILGIILELMPSWSLGSIDASLIGKYRTFEVADENLYNFIKGTLQKSYNCIFDFDTYNRRINVKDVSSAVATNPVYISFDNLASKIEVEENTEDIVTRLDVNGADGVSIRDVNPSGTNQIINLDYFMTADNFDEALINKYYSWKETYENYQLPYYNLSIEYALQVMRRTTEEAALVELEGEMTVLENEQAIVIQSIAQNLMSQSDLNNINSRINAKQSEINAKKSEIASIDAQAKSIYTELAEINSITNFRTYFTEDEYIILDRYIKDDSVSESSFVVQETSSYTDSDIGNKLSSATVRVSGADITYVTNSKNKDIYDIKGGELVVDNVSADIIDAAFERASDGSFVMTAYLGVGSVDDTSFKTACLSLTGTVSSLSNSTATLTAKISSSYMYFTFNTSEYEKRSVAWDLYEYGNEILTKISQPSYTFGVTSANFLCLEDFISFKNSVRHGEKIYVSIEEDMTLAPIVIGMKLSYESPNSLTLEFSDTYLSSDSSFRLADLLEQSISMGKNVDLSKFTYSAFVDSGASTRVKDFMTTALDVSKNAILSSKDQAITWGDSGIRLRKWTDESHEAYEPQQVWMNNNSILMTSNNWTTAELAIGHFYDENLGDLWGIVAPNIVGTLLAGSNLVIESAKQDGGVAVFKVDADGCVLHNSDFSITSGATNTHILLDAEHGIAVGTYPLIDSSGNINEDNYKFWVDEDGNLFFKGTLRAADGEFTGKVTATSGYIGNYSNGWTIGSTSIYNGKPSLDSTTRGIYIGTDGISLGSGSYYVKMTNTGALSANNVDINGKITATSGYIGGVNGWTIGSTYIYNSKPSLSSTTTGVYIGTDGISLGSGTSVFKVTSTGNITITGYATEAGLSNGTTIINGGCIQTGTIDTNRLNVASIITVGGIATTKDIPTQVSQLINDSGYQNASQVTTITTSTVTTSYVNALGVTAAALVITNSSGYELLRASGTTVKIGDFTVARNESRSYIYSNAHSSLYDTSYAGVYLGTDGLSIYGSGGTNYVRFDVPNGTFEFKGKIIATSGTFSGSLEAATGTFSGKLQAATGTFAGNLSAAGGTFSGTLSAARGSFSGTIDATAGSIAGWTIGWDDNLSMSVVRSPSGVYGKLSWTTTGTDLKYIEGYIFTALTIYGLAYVVKSGSSYSSATLGTFASLETIGCTFTTNSSGGGGIYEI